MGRGLAGPDLKHIARGDGAAIAWTFARIAETAGRSMGRYFDDFGVSIKPNDVERD